MSVRPLALSVALVLAAPAAAAPGGDPQRPSTAATFSCQVAPQDPPARGQLQSTSYTVTLTGGSLAANTKVEIRLGVAPATGPVQTTVCTSSFQRGVAHANAVPVSPVVTDPAYVWQCTAKPTAAPCEGDAVPN